MDSSNTSATPVMAYFDTADLCLRFRCSSRTIFRWMTRKTNPFPQPRMRHSSATNRWTIADVLAWEKREAALCRQTVA